MQTRFVANFHSRQGREYFVRIIDNESKALGWNWPDDEPKQLDIQEGGISIQYADSNLVYEEIIPSTCDLLLYIRDDYQKLFLKNLQLCDDFQFYIHITVVENGVEEDYWRGALTPSAVEYEHKIEPRTCKLTFSCGLSILKEREFVDEQGDKIHTGRDLRRHIGYCLSQLPHIEMYSGVTVMLESMCDLYHANHFNNSVPKDPLRHSLFKTERYYGSRDSSNSLGKGFFVKNKSISCYDVLQQIMLSFNLRLFQANGRYYAYSPTWTLNTFTNTINNQEYRLYRYKYAKNAIIYEGGTDNTFADSLTMTQSQSASEPYDVQIEDSYVVATGSTESSVHPIKQALLTHTGGGSQAIFPSVDRLYIRQAWYNDTNHSSQPAAGNSVIVPIGFNINTFASLASYGILSQEYPSNTIFEEYYSGASALFGPLTTTDLNGSISDTAPLVVTAGTGMRLTGTIRGFFPSPRNSDTSSLNPVCNKNKNIGSKPIVRMKLKVGDYYLKQDLTPLTSADFPSTEYTVGNWGEIGISALASGVPSVNLQYYPVVALTDATWTTNENDTFDFHFIQPGKTRKQNVQGDYEPVACAELVHLVEQADGTLEETVYHGGLFTINEDNQDDQLRYSIESRQVWGEDGTEVPYRLARLETEIDLTIPPLPDSALDQEGVTIEFSVYGYDADNTLHADAVYTVDVNNDPVSPGPNASDIWGPHTPYFKDFQLYLGGGEVDSDILYTATLDVNSEVLDVGQTVVGGSPMSTGPGSPPGIMVQIPPITANDNTFTGVPDWESVTLGDLGRTNQQLLQRTVQSYVQFYQKTRPTMSLVLYENGSGSYQRFHLGNRLRYKYHDIITGAASYRVMCPTQLEHNLHEGLIRLTAVVTDSNRASLITDAEEPKGGDLLGLGGGGGMPGPVFGGKKEKVRVSDVKPADQTKLDLINLNATSTGVDTITGFTGGGSGLTQEQIDKLLAIVINSNGEITDFTVNGTVLDYTNVSGAAAASTVLANSQQIQGILQKTANITIDQAGNVTQIQTLANAISANSILTFSTKQFISSSDLAQIGTNTTDISSLSTTLGEVTSVIKGSTAGTGKGLYSDTNSATESSVVVNANLISASVETGSSGTETSTTALRITGGTTAGDATVNFDVPTAGISHDDLDNRPPLYHGIGLDAAGTGGFLIGTGSVDFVEGDLLSFTYNNNAGIYQCISATTINRASTAGGVFTNWLTRVNNFTHVGARGDLSLGSLDSSTPSDNFTDSLSTFSLTTTTNITFQAGGAIGLFGTVFSTGTITAAGFSTTGTGSIGTLVASNLNYPTSDGTSGQVLTTDGSGNLSFSTVSAGGSGTVTSVGITAGSGLTVSGSPITTSGSITVGIGSDSVTTAMLQDESVDDNKLADNAVSTDKIANLNVTSAKMSNTGVTAGSYTSADITVDAAGRITAASSGSGGGGGGGYGGPIPLTTISGRWQWAGTDSNERVMTGMSTYGPYNWYSHSTEPSISTILTYTGTEVVDSTNAIMPAYYHQAFGVQIPTTDKKVRVDFAFRMQNFGSGALIGMSLWGADYPSQGNAGNVTWTLRGESADVTTISTSTIGLYTGSFTTNSIVTEDTLLPMWEHRGGTTLSTTTYIFGQFHVYLVN